MLAIYGANIVTPTEIIENGLLLTDGAHIADVRPAAAGGWPLSAESVNAVGLTLLPGFLDVHIHGGGGHDTMEATPDALRAICRIHAIHGTTGLLLTTMTQSHEAISAALGAARYAWVESADFCPDGAQVLGVHVEGPYISPQRPGAQPAQFVRPYDKTEFALWRRSGGGAIKLITLAPEMPDADALIAACVKAGIVVSLGHTNATAAETRHALDGGATHATHLFNAMPPIHHRSPGPIPVLLADERARVEIIADGHHLAPEIVEMVIRGKGVSGVILITDAMAGAGAGDGTYDLGGNPVTVAGGKAVLADGTLAGSVLTLDRAAANVRKWAGVDWPDIARLTSTNAADQMNWPKRGRIAPDCYADFVLVDDNLTVHETYVAGRCVFRR